MRLWPRSLLWRSVLLIALLLVIANLAWVQIFRVSERTPRARQTAQQIASVVNITRVTLTRSGVPGVWVSFRIDGEPYWVYLPRSRIERNEPLRWIGWGVIVL